MADPVNYLRKHSVQNNPLLDVKCEVSLFNSLRTEITPQFLFSLSLCLKLTMPDITQLEKDYIDHCRRVVQTLWKWRERSGSDATNRKLIEACLEAGNCEIADFIVEHLKKKTSTDQRHTEQTTDQSVKPQVCQHELKSARRLSDSSRPSALSMASRRTQSRESYSTNDQYSGNPRAAPSRSCSYDSFSRPKPPNRRPRFISESTVAAGSKSISWNTHKKLAARGTLQPNNKASQIFDIFYDDLVDIVCSDPILRVKFFGSLIDYLHWHPIEEEKAKRISCTNIGCRAFMGAVSTFIRRARNPETSLNRVLMLLVRFDKFRDIADTMRSRALDADIVFPLQLQSKRRVPNVLLEPVAIAQDERTCTMKESLELPPPSSSTMKYADKLRSFYKQLQGDPKWSPAKARKITEFVELAVISLNDDSSEQSVPLSDLFQVKCGSWILIEGIPGIGKSTFAYEMCSQWAEGTALQQYSLVLLLRLCDVRVQSKFMPDSLDQLVGVHLNKQSWKDKAVQDIIDDGGQGVLMILEGYDELPEDKQAKDYVKNIVHRLKADFSEATVMITTRPSTSHFLTESIQFTKHVEIRGFTKSSRKRFIEVFFKGSKNLQESFEKYIERYPKISGCLYIPLNLVIVLDIFNTLDDAARFPETMTELYESLVRMLIYRHLASKEDRVSFISLSSLPPPVQQRFSVLCELAYDGLKDRRHHFFMPDEFDTLGLMRKDSMVLHHQGDTFAYSFLHLTIQEFLAANHVHRMQPNAIKHHFKRYNRVAALSMMMRFLAGLTRGLHLDDMPTDNICRPDIFHQLLEAKNDSRASKILSKRDVIKVSRISSILTPYDMYAIGQCMALSKCTWRCGFTLRALTHEHMKMLVAGLSASAPQLQPVIDCIGFSLNPIGNEGLAYFLDLPVSILKPISEFLLRATSLDRKCLEHLAKKIAHFHILKKFLFHDNYFREGEQKPLIKALCQLDSIRKVSFSMLSPDECTLLLTRLPSLSAVELYELSPPSIEAVLNALPTASMECIEIYQSQMTMESVSRLARSLSFSVLKSLKLVNCAIDSDIAQVIVDAIILGPKIETLNLNDNLIDDIGGRYIAGKLRIMWQKNAPRSNHLTELHLNRNRFSKLSIHDMIIALAWFKESLDVYLSLQWKDHITEYVASNPLYRGAMKHFHFGNKVEH